MKLPPKIPTMRQINKRRKKFVGISTFSGCGGSCTGHKMAGIDIQYANEFIPEALNTYVLNHKSYCDDSDIRTVKARDILKRLGLKKGQLPFMDGSPPCSAFSTAGTREKGWGEEKKYSDSAQQVDDLFFEYCRLLNDLKPWVFVAENVTGLVKGSARGYFIEITNALKACGYVVKCYKIRASWLGVPQARERMIYVGVRKDLAKKAKVQPVAPTPAHREVTVAEMLPHIALIKSKKGDVIQYVDANIPHPTITASDGSTSPTAKFSTGGYIETWEGEQRKYTIEELKVICGFPSDFKLTGKFEQQWERLGRSVPPQMMYCITKEIVNQILIPIAEMKGLDYESGPVYG